MTLTLDPHGLWRRHRFEFCTALEKLMDAKTESQRQAHWSELERLGVRKGEK